MRFIDLLEDALNPIFRQLEFQKHSEYSYKNERSRTSNHGPRRVPFYLLQKKKYGHKNKLWLQKEALF